MIIDAYYLNIRSFTNRYQSGIEWSFVGGRPRAIDNGTGTAKWFADLEIAVTDRLSLDAIIAMLESYTGGSVNVNLADYEPIFGPEIDYSTALPCYITSISAVKDTTSPLWILSLGLGADLYDYLLPSVPSDLRVGSIQSIDRESGHSFVTGTKGSGLYGTSFGWNGKTATVEWFAKREDAETLRLSLINGRSSVLQVGLALSWLFDEPTDITLGQTEYAYVLNVGECVPDMSANWYRLSATLGKAQEPVQNEPQPEWTDVPESVLMNSNAYAGDGYRYLVLSGALSGLIDGDLVTLRFTGSGFNPVFYPYDAEGEYVYRTNLYGNDGAPTFTGYALRYASSGSGMVIYSGDLSDWTDYATGLPTGGSLYPTYKEIV